MKLALITVSKKGGTGKSMTAKSCADYVRSNGIPAGLFDSDGEVGDLARFYSRGSANPLIGVAKFDLDAKDGPQLVGETVDLGADVLLIDTRGGANKKIASFFRRPMEFVDFFASAGYRAVFVAPINHLPSTAETLVETIQRFGPDAGYLAVRNLAQAAPEEMIYFENEESIGNEAIPIFGGEHAIDILRKAGGLVIDMPALSNKTLAKLERNPMTFSEALEDAALETNGGPMKRLDQFALDSWIRDMNKAWGKVFKHFSARK